MHSLMHPFRPSLLNAKQQGISLIEVLVALIIIAVGILGIGKMQAASISNTQVSGSRGLVALQATSLADILHSNKAFWQTASPPCATTCVLQQASLAQSPAGSIPNSNPCTPSNTVTAACTKAQIATYEINKWMSNINLQVPTYKAGIQCIAGTPSNCIISITWVENQVAANNTTTAGAAANKPVSQTYYLYVQP